jgi:hypothetical protein
MSGDSREGRKKLHSAERAEGSMRHLENSIELYETLGGL